MLTFMKSIIDTFGSAIIVPIIIFIIAKIFKVTTKKSFLSAVYAGVALQGFTLILNSFTPIITPVINRMVDSTGVNLPVFDVGWQATSLVAFSTSAGMIYLGLGILLQTILFLVKWTDVFQPSDLWNNYSYMVWGAMVIGVTGNFPLGIGCMVLLNLYSLLISELVAKRWSSYYRYPNCTIIAMHNVEASVFAVFADPIYNKLGLNKIKLNPKELEKKLGFLGEPITLGLFLGMFIGILGNMTRITTMEAWGEIMKVGISTSAVMAIFPKVASMFAQAFAPITEAARKIMQKAGNREWYIAVNDAVGYGEPATLISGLILIPIMLVVAMILPGNQVLPVVDLLAIPYMVQGLVAVHNGNIPKVIVSGIIWFGLGLYICTSTAPLFTDMATSVGVAIPAGAMLITSFNILGKPLMGLVFFAFLSANPLYIGLAVVIYFILWALFRKNKTSILEYLEKQALKNVAEEPVVA
ncbi:MULTISPECIES: PTS galactitol transporter subunit IIC [unclassified Clostridioides]|uniref:PTS galactitol transporter subunit IIC n=1 Tax=unclassified Clostridioides TaxID=2635829 RepID=UPI001D102E0A|nr:PTS galactitol transporter subunit IIC [Clostridioides sp. ZZV14-6150]MCC0660327.1 PTS galactitol transporter subunit IIC [Clostridioides sp. ZZV14-6154]MCC0667514.1 PTS galactitol transporter subunit IIC [Clostridioides sp. ZZV14-6153]MCC0720343.1 PTS galactitol transporter subunit IIC [Clostridioides sp. ZZV14-6105]MCC0720873.1 PTS galactitol transporter subunit IIC [Clostridioides sp. ZZV14-6104]MCC0728526.1 PTS galactitol transporter subunit IIC [Clostridioides sp. ZZV14-6045]MCC073114